MIGSRTSAAALVAATAAAASLVALPADAGVARTRATVTLQVVPRGQGRVTSSVPDAAAGSTSCKVSEEPDDCRWTFAAGTAVVLSAKPDPGATFARWSTPDCPGTGDCKLTLDGDTSIVALFGKLTLSVDTSGAGDGDLVTSAPAGISCPPTCAADFDAGATVTLTVATGAGSTFTSFPYGCTSTNGRVCTTTVLDQPQSVGAKFNGSQGPQEPAVVKVTVKVAKSGDGAGRVTATGLDCGGVCSASFPYGTLAGFTAAADSGSLFDGWGGICASNLDLRCTLPVGPITSVRPRFRKDAPPGPPGALTVAAPTATSLTVSWGAATDDVGVKAYELYVGADAAPRVSTGALTATIGGLDCGKTYALAVLAVDGSGNRSARTSAQASTARCAPPPLHVDLIRGSVVRRRLVVRFRATAATRGSASLAVGGRAGRPAGIKVRAGVNSLSFALPRGAAGRARVVLRLVDPAGGTRTVSWLFRVKA